MLTPTGVTYAQYWDAIKAGNPTHVRFTFLGQNIVLDDTDVYLNSGVVVTDMFNGDTDLVFGRTLSKQITVTVLNSSKLNDLKWTGEFTLEFGVDIGSPATTYWVNMGYFTGEKPKNVTSVQTIAFTAYDRMSRFDVLADEFVKSLTYPKTVSQIYDALCTYVGIQNVAGDELANIKSRSFASAPAEMEGYTCRDLLAMIAEACGCYAKITAEGKVKLVWFTDNTAHAVTGTEEFSVESGDVNDGMTWDEADTYYWDDFDNFTWDDVCGYQEALRIDRLYVKQLSSDMDINYPYDYGDMVYSIVDNPFLSVASYADVTSYLKPIYDRLYSFGGYLPVSLECVGNWCVEAGDIITIDVNNLTITFPIFVKSMRWSGAINDAYETTGTTNRQIYSSEANKQRVLTSKEIKMYVDDNYYKIRSGITIAPEGVTISGGRFINITSPSGSVLIDGNGVDITGSKYIHLQADTNNKWYIDDQGLSLYNSVRNTRAIQFSGSFDAQTLHAEAGIYAFNPGGDTTHGRLAFVASDMANLGYNFAVLEYDYNIGLSFQPYNDLAMRLGKSTNRFLMGYIVYLYSHYLMGNDSNGEFVMNPSANADRQICFSDYTGSTSLGIKGYTKNGGGWDVRNIIFTGQIVAPSSRSMKHNIKELKSVSETIDKLSPVEFVYNNDTKGQKHFGLIYEDTIGLIPEICQENQGKDGKKDKSINYVELVPLLLKEIQDLRKRVSELEEEVKG